MSIFTKIINGTIPSFKVYESDTAIAFLDINPLSSGHTLVVPKHNAVRLHELPQNVLQGTTEALSIVSKAIVKATGCSDYNIIQNNGTLAGQEVKHVHFHIIPKPDEDEGVGLRWPAQKGRAGALKTMAAMILNSIRIKDVSDKGLKENSKPQVKQKKQEGTPNLATTSISHSEMKSRDDRLEELEKRVDMLTRTVTILMKGTNSRGKPATFVTAKCPITGKNAPISSDEVHKVDGICPITKKRNPVSKKTISDATKECSNETLPFKTFTNQSLFPKANSKSTCQVPGCECDEVPKDCKEPCAACKHGAVYHPAYHTINMNDPGLFKKPVSGDNMVAISNVCAKLCKEIDQRKNETGWPGCEWIKKVESKLKDCSSATAIKKIRSDLMKGGEGFSRAVLVIEKELGYKLGESWRDPFDALGCPFGFDKISKKNTQKKKGTSGGKCPFGFDK